MGFLKNTNRGVPDASLTDGDFAYADRDKVEWAQYLNSVEWAQYLNSVLT